MNKSIADTCIARNICSAHGSLCSERCVGYMETEHQIRLSGIPKSYWNIQDNTTSATAAAELINGDNPNCRNSLGITETTSLKASPPVLEYIYSAELA